MTSVFQYFNQVYNGSDNANANDSDDGDFPFGTFSIFQPSDFCKLSCDSELFFVFIPRVRCEKNNFQRHGNLHCRDLHPSHPCLQAQKPQGWVKPSVCNVVQVGRNVVAARTLTWVLESVAQYTGEQNGYHILLADSSPCNRGLWLRCKSHIACTVRYGIGAHFMHKTSTCRLK